MAVTLTLIGKTPGQTQFGLDTFTESYKCDATADIVLTDTSVPAIGDAHPVWGFMFVTNRYCSETSESASALDLVYTGLLQTNGDTDPVLPLQKPSTGGQIASVSTNTDADIFPATTTNPLTLQYYSITNTLSFVSNDPDDAAEPTDPREIVVTDFVSWDLGFGGQPAGSFPALEAYWLASALVQRIVEPPADIEPLVSGQFYQITKRKTRTLFPYAPPS